MTVMLPLLMAYLFLKSEFVFFDFSKPILLFFVDYTAIMILFGSIGFGIACTAAENKVGFS